METKEITIEPKVDSAQEFIEIALDFSNPLDLVRDCLLYTSPSPRDTR